MKSRKKCTYKEFVQLFPFVGENEQQELLGRLRSQPRPGKLCGVSVAENLNAISYGMLDDLRSASETEEPIQAVVRVLLGVNPDKLMDEDVNDVFGFFSFIKSEIEKINKLFSDIKHTYSREEVAAGVHDLDFGSFGVLDWYARRMGIANQNEVRDIAWVRIYKCMKNDAMQSEYERRLQKQYTKK